MKNECKVKLMNNSNEHQVWCGFYHTKLGEHTNNTIIQPGGVELDKESWVCVNKGEATIISVAHNGEIPVRVSSRMCCKDEEITLSNLPDGKSSRTIQVRQNGAVVKTDYFDLQRCSDSTKFCQKLKIEEVSKLAKSSRPRL